VERGTFTATAIFRIVRPSAPRLRIWATWVSARIKSSPDGFQPAVDTTVPVETATREPVRRLQFRLAALPGPLPEMLRAVAGTQGLALS
jgi:hypothetical protein